MVKHKGFTLMEMIVYIGLSALLLALVVSFFKVTRRQYESASSSYLIGQEATQAIQWLKRDLQETALSTIRVKNESLPSMSLVATSEEGYPRSFGVSRYGTPDWNRHSFYNLTDEGELLRWDRPLADLESPKRFLPLPSTANPRDSNGGESKKVLLRSLLMPNETVKIDGKDAPFPAMTQWGGFKPGFVVYDADGKEHLVAENPSQISEMMVTDSGASVNTLDGVSIPIDQLKLTRLMEVQIALKLDGFRENSPSAVMIPLRVTPLH